MTLLKLLEVLKEHDISANIRYEKSSHEDRYLIVLTKHRDYISHRQYVTISKLELASTKEPEELIKFKIKRAIDELNRLPKE